MSKRAFLVTMVTLLVVGMTVVIAGACTLKREDTSVTPPQTHSESHSEEITASAKEVPTETVKSVSKATESVTETTTEETTVDERPIEEIAQEVMDGVYGNGEEREQALGDRYEEVQRYVDDSLRLDGEDSVGSDYGYAGDYSRLNPTDGVNYYNGVLETYYNMDMSAWLEFIYSLGYTGEYWVRSDGVKMFGDYIIVAADYGWLPRGTVIETSLGTGMVLDTGEGGWYWTDIATSW